MRKCSCGAEIPPARLRALPLTTTCVNCSTENPVRGQVHWLGKHTPVLQVVAAEDFDPGRRGFHAQIGTHSYTNPYLIKAEIAAGEVRNLSKILKEERIEAEAVNMVPARCHPERPKMNPAGDCVECALAKQRQRVRR